MKFSAKLGERLAAGGCALALACTLLFGGNAVASTSQKTAHKTTSSKTSASAKSSSAKHRSKSRHSRRSRKVASWRRGQQRIDSDRARAIQEALIREGYMHGSASGSWDQTSQHAMEKFQADNGWQTKVVPDSRALIKLGLGPNHDHLLNPESAMTGPIPAASAAGHADAPVPSAIAPVSTGAGVSQPQR